MPLVYFAERLNRLGARHWRSFAGQDYFDPHGVFASALLSAPLLLVMFVILVGAVGGCDRLIAFRSAHG